MTQSEIHAKAQAAGFTVGLIIEGGHSTIECWSQEGADWDGHFEVMCMDTGERLVIHGWNCDVDLYE